MLEHSNIDRPNPISPADLYMKGQENYERYQAKKELINTVVDKVHENLPGPLDGVKKVMKGLETVANIHPLVGGVVGVFKVCLWLPTD